MLRVGLTGGIGAGKSTAARRLRERGAVVVDADAVAREVVAPGTPGLAAVAAEFGPGVIAPDGSLDRPALGALVFGGEGRAAAGDARRRLEVITHPLVHRRTAELVAAAVDADPAVVVVHDVPLLVELGRGAEHHLVAVVHVPAEERVRRLVRDRGMPEAAARARIAAQADDPARRAAADAWLENTGTPADLVAAVDRLWDGRIVPFEAGLRAGRPAPRPAHPVVVAADPGWAAAGERVVARVRRAAGERALDVQHTGSTAVPGLDAQDVVDLQVVVADSAAARDLVADLTAAGLVAGEGERRDGSVGAPGRSAGAIAIAVEADPGRAVDCRVRVVGDPAVREVTAVRDRLRADPGARAAYAALKHRMAAGATDVDAYAAGRTAFLRALLTGG